MFLLLADPMVWSGRRSRLSLVPGLDQNLYTIIIQSSLKDCSVLLSSTQFRLYHHVINVLRARACNQVVVAPFIMFDDLVQDSPCFAMGFPEFTEFIDRYKFNGLTELFGQADG
jgi:hypothetical protein